MRRKPLQQACRSLQAEPRGRPMRRKPLQQASPPEAEPGWEARDGASSPPRSAAGTPQAWIGLEALQPLNISFRLVQVIRIAGPPGVRRVRVDLE
jgi:hypothetical protein